MRRRLVNGRSVFSPRWAALAATVALLAALVVVNAAAIREIVHARGDARRLARSEMGLRLEERAQAFRARLAALQADLVFLAESEPLRELPGRMLSGDPMVRRWARLNAEGALLLFLQAHPPLERLELITPTGPATIVGRREGVATVLPPGWEPPPAAEGLVATRLSIPGSAGALLAGWADPARVLGEGEDPFLGALTLSRRPPAEPREELAAAVRIEDGRWEPPVELWLSARREASEMERSAASLARGYRRTVIWNLTVIVAVSAAVALALRQMRQRARAEAAVEHERRVRELERGLLHSERLASVGRFAAGVAHEVNNPLEGMANYLSLLEGDLESGRADAARLRARQVREGLDRAAAIVRRVLAFSDPARSPREVVDLAGPVREAAEFLAPRFPEVAIVVRGGASGGALRVAGNRVALGQLFLNLLLNACEELEAGGRIEVELERTGDEVVARLRDDGPGLAAEALDHLFEPFYSTRGSTGLGLALCHGIVRDHGGRISAANAPGGGALFEIRLPAAGTAGAEPRAEGAPA
ncbi:MAG: ATP-binding protein [Thermoanaerobaculia bacterium]|nr:ATP-binding protein [Thermoanaerobaculia bacterium]